MSKRTPVRELIRLAMVYAESDRMNMSKCDNGPDGKEARALAEEFRAYRMKYWGKTKMETNFENAQLVEVRTMLHQEKP